MSKMDGLRAMREARYEAARATKPAAPAKRPTPLKADSPPAAAEAAPAEPSPATEALCGHRAISGRTCTREHGHAAKSHRYS